MGRVITCSFGNDEVAASDPTESSRLDETNSAFDSLNDPFNRCRIGIKMNLKEQLRFFLKKRDLTPAELARRSGVSRQVLSLWLDGVEPRKLRKVRSVANALGTTIDNLCFGTGEVAPPKAACPVLHVAAKDWESGIIEIQVRKTSAK